MTTSLLMASLATIALQAAPSQAAVQTTTTTVVTTQHTHIQTQRTEVRWQVGQTQPAPWVAPRRDHGRRRGGRHGDHGRDRGHHDGRGNATCNNLQTLSVMAVAFPEEGDQVAQVAQLVCGNGFGIPRQWPNGRIGRMSDTTWYWPNGRLARNGENTFYWPNGRLAQNGKSTFYWPNGRLARNGTNTRYWPNGRLAQNGTNTWYWPSGRLAKNGTNTYFTPEGRMLQDRGSFLYAVCMGQEWACRRRGGRDMTMPELLGLGWR